MKEGETRAQIIKAADELFYRQGYGHTSFADIAAAVKISRGNFYHHFQTKDQLLDAVINTRLGNTQHMLDEWERLGKTPSDRIKRFMNLMILNRNKIMLYGCPVGTLCTELVKTDNSAQSSASQLFTLFRTWLRRQFVLLGCKKDGDDLAMHLLIRSQGVAALANAFQNEAFIRREVGAMHDWLDSKIVGKGAAGSAQ